MPPAIWDPPSMFLYIGVGAGGVALGAIVLVVFTYRRVRRRIDPGYRLKKPPPRRAVACCSLASGVLLIPVGAAFFFCGVFLQAYHAFTREVPVAEIITLPLDSGNGNRLNLIQVLPTKGGKQRFFFLRQDQWTLEGDIVKWEHWLNFLGLHTHYRLTRIRGRYIDFTDEVNAPDTVYSLADRENQFPWRSLFAYGQKLPFISTVYGNAVYQNANTHKHYMVYVSPSGFVVRSTGGRQTTGDKGFYGKELGSGSGGKSSHLSGS